MGKAGRVLLGLIAGYIIGGVLGFAGLEMLSSNSHDKSLEAAMTGAFVTGPLGAFLGVILALVWRRHGVKP